MLGVSLQEVSGTATYPSMASVSAGGASAVPSQEIAKAAPREVDENPAVPRYFSPVFQYHEGARQLVMIFRDRDTGETTNQIPSEAVLKSYETALRRQGGQEDGRRADEADLDSINADTDKGTGFESDNEIVVDDEGGSVSLELANARRPDILETFNLIV